MWTKSDRKQFWIFCAIAMGVPLLLFLPYLGLGSDPNVTLFSHVVVLLPAFAAVVCNWVVQGEGPVPKRFYGFFSLIVLITAGFYFAELFTSTPLESVYFPFVECTLAVIALFILAFEPRGAKTKYGLSFTAGKGSTAAGVTALFVFLYFSILIPDFTDPAYTEAFTAQLDQKALYLFFLPFVFFLTYLPFLGEEYGWRYCLLPLLQKRFGYWIGTLISGILWGLWHVPMLIFSQAGEHIFYMGAFQIAFCICLGFFFAFAKEVTNNIWLMAFLHYLNNEFAVFVFLEPSSVGKIDAAGPFDVLAVFLYNTVYILPFLIYRLYLYRKRRKVQP